MLLECYYSIPEPLTQDLSRQGRLEEESIDFSKTKNLEFIENGETNYINNNTKVKDKSEDIYTEIFGILSNSKLIALENKFYNKNLKNQKDDVFIKDFDFNHKNINFLVRKVDFSSEILTEQQVLNINQFKSIQELKHPNLIKCIAYYINESDKTFYFLYENHTLTLREFLTRKTLDFKSKLKIFKSLIEMLLYFHSQGIICLDLSIDNIFFTQSKLKLKLSNFGKIKQ